MQSKPTSVTFSTTPPTAFTDGSPIPAGAEIKYKFKYQLSDNPSPQVLPVQDQPSVVYSNIKQMEEARTLTASVRCIVNGVESAESETTDVKIPPLLVPEPPAAPSIDVTLS